MAAAWSIIRLLAAGMLLVPGYCIARNQDETSLLNEVDACINLQFELVPIPDNFSEIDLATVCPGLLVSLTDSMWINSIAIVNHEHANLAQLADLRFFLQGTSITSNSGQILDYTRLSSILTDILSTKEPDQGVSWWEQLLAWLKQHQEGQEDNELDWLREWLETISLSESTTEAITYGIAILMILLAAVFIINEIRLARQGKSAFRKDSEQRRTITRLLSSEIETEPNLQHLSDKVPELLNACIEYLINNQRLPEIRSRTNCEFHHHLLLNEDSAAPGFCRLLQQAENVLYGDRQIDEETVQKCRQDAADLLHIASP